ncbi:MAG: hypothetical protein IJ996_00305 [Clostridia bacterium]|nr:hypothetical protein [Clostridia bacterium]
MKKIKKALVLMLSAFMAFSGMAVGCAQPEIPNENDALNEEIDPNRTQIHVFCFDGGFGSDWLVSLKKKFEEMHKNDSYEDGKTGVQIMINPEKDELDVDEISYNKNELFFTENAYYYDLLRANALADITDAVTGSLSKFGDERSIESKLTDAQKAYYGVKDDNEKVHYYGIPHYSIFMQMNYNVDLFDQKGYYFLDVPTGETLEDRFVYDVANDKRSKGPDGVYNTFDDGLPATYEEFFLLCDYIYQCSDIPLTWAGKVNKGYLSSLLQALAVDYEGAEQSSLYYNMDGKPAKNLGRVVNGSFVEDETDTIITEENGYELARQAGKYYGLQFIEKIVNTEKYHNALAFNTGHSHMDAQTDFLNAGHDGVTNESAILIDGIWWESEATATFNSMVKSKGEQFSKANRKFAYLPLPKATASKATETAQSNTKFTLCDYSFSLMYMKKNVAEWKKPLLMEFLQFCNTNENLVEFTQITSAIKSIDYTATEDDMKQMSHYTKSLFNMKKVSDIIQPFSTTDLYVNNQLFFSPLESYYSKLPSGTNMQYPIEAFREKNVSVNDYFSGMYTYFSGKWGSLK